MFPLSVCEKTNLRWQPPSSPVTVHAEAALPGDPDQSRVGARRRGRRQLIVAERSAADGAIDAGALVFAAGTEALTVLVDPAVVLASASFQFS